MYIQRPKYLNSFCSEISGFHFHSHYFLANFKISEVFPMLDEDQQEKLSSNGILCTQEVLQTQLVAHHATLSPGKSDSIDLRRFVPSFTRSDLSLISKLLLDRPQSCFHLLFCTTSNYSTIQHQFKINCTAPQSASYLNIPQIGKAQLHWRSEEYIEEIHHQLRWISIKDVISRGLHEI